MKIYKRIFPVIITAFCLLAAGCEKNETLPESSQTESISEGASESFSDNAPENVPEGASEAVLETASQIEVVEEGMEPVYGSLVKDGVYQIKVNSSSNMFQIVACQLTVEDGKMTAEMTMSGKGYLKLYMGTGEEALAAADKDYIPYVENEEGMHTFQVPVEALDMGINCSAFSKNKEKWYDRVLVFRADSLPLEAYKEGMAATAESLGLEDGMYKVQVDLGGGSGKSSVQSPTSLRVENGQAFATIIWGSPNYDYMKVNGEKYERMDAEGNSSFEIPVMGFDWKLPVIADTIAMSQPHEIEYTLIFHSSTLEKAETEPVEKGWEEEKINHSMELLYAEQFSVDYYDNGYTMLNIKESGRYLVVPKGQQVPADIPQDVVVIQRPLDNIYLAATSAMDLFSNLDSVHQITLSGTKEEGWYINEAKEAFRQGNMVYAGKYNAPDYERILSKSCDLAIESTMIYHSPEVKEQLENLGIPVLVERSSYESHPLGRMEWIKLYGALLGKDELAKACFQEQVKNLEAVMNQQPTGKTAAFFYISSNGYVNVRKSGDYVAKIIQLAGGSYVPENLEENENALSTMNMQMEAFYAAAREADYLIYNSTVDGQLYTLEQLLDKSSILADFKAVKQGHVWCTEKNLFQETMGLGNLILDINKLFTEEPPKDEEMTYLYQLK